MDRGAAAKNLLWAVKGIKHREQWTKSKPNAGNGSLRVPSMATKAGIPRSRANCICDLCESLGANDIVIMFCDSKNPPKLATCKTREKKNQLHIKPMLLNRSYSVVEFEEPQLFCDTLFCTKCA